MQDTPTHSRRTFLKVSALGLGALAAGMAGSAVGCAPSTGATTAVSLEEVEWDGVFDVLVVGFGAAGAASALSAADEGSSVLLLDKAPEGGEGGNTRFSSQLFITARESQGALDYLTALNGGFATPGDVTSAYAEGLVKLPETLAGWGLDAYRLLDVTDITPEKLAALEQGQ